MENYFNKRIVSLFGITLLAAVMVLASCKTEPDVPTYMVTFTMGTEIITSQSVPEGDKVSKPAAPARLLQGLYKGAVADVSEKYQYVEWLNGRTPWNFEADTVSGDITLTANWNNEAAGRVDYSTQVLELNILDKAIACIKEDLAKRETISEGETYPSAEYTFFLGEDLLLAAEGSSYYRLQGNSVTGTLRSLKLTLIGIEQERKIQLGNTTRGTLFTIGAIADGPEGVELILGNNITLVGMSSSDAYYSYNLVTVGSKGRFTMLEGSKITGHKATNVNSYGSPLYVQGTFTMKGGVITGNEGFNSTQVARSVGAVRLSGSTTTPASFIMEGGSISGNIGYSGDVFISNADVCTLSGTASIETLCLYASNTTDRSQLKLASGWTGAVTTLNLVEYRAPSITLWADQLVVQAAEGYSLTTSDVGKFKLGKVINQMYSKPNNGEIDLSQLESDLSTAYEIGSTADNMGKLVKK